MPDSCPDLHCGFALSVCVKCQYQVDTWSETRWTLQPTSGTQRLTTCAQGVYALSAVCACCKEAPTRCKYAELNCLCALEGKEGRVTALPCSLLSLPPCPSNPHGTVCPHGGGRNGNEQGNQLRSALIQKKTLQEETRQSTGQSAGALQRKVHRWAANTMFRMLCMVIRTLCMVRQRCKMRNL